ncbi:MAG: methyltransferase domain-containing protein [Desulfomonile tiedjei]|nr:methyltransferase domain-containing protein [Desulfomonile tiedjei]
MDEDKVIRIKRAVRENFDRSPAIYHSFEERYGFFKNLNKALLSGMSLPRTADVLDVGCGTGASSIQILEALPHCRVWGLDNSPAMLETARSTIGVSDRLTFVEGDAATLSEYFSFPFDAIIYSASIFLIPDYQQSLRQAQGLLKDKGSVGLTFMEGLFDATDNNLMAVADQEAKEGVSLKKPVNLGNFQSFFADLFPRHRTWKENFALPEELLREFFSIPAMSAGLFPGIEYPERLRKVASLFDHMPKTQILFRWILMVGQKTAVRAV